VRFTNWSKHCVPLDWLTIDWLTIQGSCRPWTPQAPATTDFWTRFWPWSGSRTPSPHSTVTRMTWRSSVRVLGVAVSLFWRCRLWLKVEWMSFLPARLVVSSATSNSNRPIRSAEQEDTLSKASATHDRTWSLNQMDGWPLRACWAIQRSWFARVNALCNLSHKKSREVAAHFRADFWVGAASRCV